MKILFTGGGSGGHLMPLVAVSRERRRLYNNPSTDSTGSLQAGSGQETLKFYYIGPGSTPGFFQLAQEPMFKTYTILPGKLRHYFSLMNIVDVLFTIPISFLQSFFWLFFIGPDLVFSKGGTGSLSVTYCARLLSIPVFLHESDMVPGRSNRITSRWAKKVFTSFEKTEYFDLEKTLCVGSPIKKELLEGDESSAKEMFGITLQKPIIMVWGGSQGAEALNDFVILALNDLLKNYEIIHVCGKKNYKITLAEAEVMAQKELWPNYHLYGTLNEIQLKHVFKVASLVISRAGAGGIFEIAATGKPSILIPLPTAAGDHQSKNAYAYAGTGAALVVEQANLTPHFFLGKIQQLISSPETLKQMSTAALAFAKPLAAKAIAREILEYLQK